MLKKLKDDLEIIFCIRADDIEKKRYRSDYQITYDTELLNLINNARKMGFTVNSVVITLYEGEESVLKFQKRLEKHNIKTYIHTFTKGYPDDIETIVSDEGYGANPYIETTKKFILVNAPGPSSGKLATCLSQLYHEYKRGIKANYAKFETFPIWDFSLRHPINLAYEASTVNLEDVILIDPYHLETYKKTAVNYNRDIKTFPILKAILHKITNKDIYMSPTDMGVNLISKCINDMEKVEIASKTEIVRRYFKEKSDFKAGISLEDYSKKVKLLMNELEIDETYLNVVGPAVEKSKETNSHAMAIKVGRRRVITGRKTDLLSPASSLILNTIKTLAKIPDDIDLLSPVVLEPILALRKDKKELSLQEVLIALSICSATNPSIEKALSYLSKLEGCDVHATFIVPNDDLRTLKSLNVNVTSQDEFYTEEVF